MPRGSGAALVLLAARVADQPGAAPGQHDRAVPGALEAAQRAELEEVAHVEAVRLGSKPA